MEMDIHSTENPFTHGYASSSPEAEILRSNCCVGVYHQLRPSPSTGVHVRSPCSTIIWKTNESLRES